MKKFLDKTKNGLVSNISTFGHSDPKLPTIVFFPMIHVGEKKFYEEIQWEMYSCDTVLLEGATGPLAKIGSKAKKVAPSFKKLRLASQKDWQKTPTIDGLDNKPTITWTRENDCDPWEKTVSVGHPYKRECLKKWVRFVRADLDENRTKEALKDFPIWAWLATPFIALFSLLSLQRSNREDLINELIKHCDESLFDEFGKAGAVASQYVTTHRNEYLAEILCNEIKNGHGKIIGINYGAQHMSKLHRLLIDKFNYKLHQTRPVLAMAYDKNYIDTEEDGYGISRERFMDLMGYVFKPKQPEKSRLRKRKQPIKTVSIPFASNVFWRPSKIFKEGPRTNVKLSWDNDEDNLDGEGAPTSK